VLSQRQEITKNSPRVRQEPCGSGLLCRDAGTAIEETAEIVEPGITGLTFPAKNPEALAEAVSTLLADNPTARRMAHQARTMVRSRYDWTGIAARTADAYRATIDNTPERRAQARARLAVRRAPIVVPEGNLLAVGGAAG